MKELDIDDKIRLSFRENRKVIHWSEAECEELVTFMQNNGFQFTEKNGVKNEFMGATHYRLINSTALLTPPS